MFAELPIPIPSTTLPRMIEVARSFSFKLNVGNYQSLDFFYSEKAECLESEREGKSQALYSFCKAEVMRAVQEACREHGLPMPGQGRSR
jgi:hypothetical protein